MTFVDRVRTSDSEEESDNKSKVKVEPIEDNRPYRKIKHIFEI